MSRSSPAEPKPPEVSPALILEALAALLAPIVAKLLVDQPAAPAQVLTAGTPRKQRRKRSPSSRLKAPDLIPSEIESARARQLMRRMGLVDAGKK